MLTLRKLNYFTDSDFLSFNAATGVLRSPGGTRLLGVNEDFLRGFVAACEYETGQAASAILKKCGVIFGKRLGQRFEQELSEYAKTPMRDRHMFEFYGLLQDLWQGCGYGHIDVGWSSGPSGYLPISLTNSPMQDIGPNGHKSDPLMNGMVEGFINHYVEQDLECIQTGDRRLGSAEGTTFVAALPEIASRVSRLVSEGHSHTAIVKALGA